jgi:3-oxoadipate enol-lactonase
MVLVPGIAGLGDVFYRQIPGLARSYRVITYTLRDRASAMSTLVEDLSSVLDAAGITREPAVLVGESFGGALALSFVLAKRTRVERLVLVNAFARVTPKVRLHFAIAGLRFFPWAAMAHARRMTVSRLHSPKTHERDIARFLEVTRRTTREGYLSRLRILRDYDVRERLAEIDVPTLFVAADRDVVVPSVLQARDMARRVRGSTVRILENHRHNCLLAPDVDLEAILSHWINSSATARE